jgi:chromosome segregation ATPase
MSDARAKLKAAIADLARLTEKIESLEGANVRAAEAVEHAKAEVATHAGLEKEITRWRVSQVKKGASTKELPESLAAKVAAKKAAESEVEQAEATLEALREELAELRKGVKPLEEARQQAALNVLLGEQIDDLAREYSEISVRERELGLLLHGLAHLQVEKNGKIEPVGYTQSIVNVLKLGEQFPQEVSPNADMGTRWQRKLNALLKDPEARIERPVAIVPSDYVRTNPEKVAHFGIPLPAEYSVRHPVE